MTREKPVIEVRRSVWEAAQDVDRRIKEIEGTFEMGENDWDWDSGYARRQWEAYERAGDEKMAELWRDVVGYFKERESTAAGTPVKIVED